MKGIKVSASRVGDVNNSRSPNSSPFIPTSRFVDDVLKYVSDSALNHERSRPLPSCHLQMSDRIIPHSERR
jgi:hypothetical protein